MKATIILLMLLLTSAAAQALSPSEILLKADDIRNPSDSYTMKVKVTSNDNQVSQFEVFTQDNDKTLIKTTKPSRDYGRNLLMLGQEMWAYIPNLKRSIRVSLAQKISGQAANGDISRMRFSGDYSAKIASENKNEWELFLESNKKGLTYDKIKIWVEKKTFHPLRAEFLTVSGKVIKRARYQDYKELAGSIRPSEIEIRDAIRSDMFSIIKIESMQITSLKSSIFNQRNLK